MSILIRTDGFAHCLYGEAIDLHPLGAMPISRASNVEPNGYGQWLADLSPASEPQLGLFASRSQTVAAEAAWLLAHRFRDVS